MIVSLSSVHGAPGVSSWALLLAAAWTPRPMVDRVVLEADPDGGVFGARYGLGVDPGVARLVAAARRYQLEDAWLFSIEGFARRLDERVWVIPGPESADATAKEWGSAAADVAAIAARDERLWIVDCGRLAAGSAARAFPSRSALSVVFCRARPDELAAVPARVAMLHRAGRVGVVVVGRSDYPLDELREFFGTGVVWQVRDSRDVASLANAVLSQRRARRSWVWREALELTGHMSRVLEAATFPEPGVTS